VSARRRALVPALVALATAAAGACSEVGTDPSAPVAIAFDTLPSLAIVEGDTLRDSLGMVAPITATAFNSAGDTIRGATFTFLARDTTNALTVDPSGAFVVAGDTSASATNVTLQASLGSLQFTRPLAIVPRPDVLTIPTTAIDPALILAPDTAALRAKNLSSSFSATVLHNATPAVPVRSWRVNFDVVALDDTLLDSARVVDASGAFIGSGTTGTDGVATVRLRIYPKNGLPNKLFRDSVIVRVSALYRKDSALAGSPDTIVVPYALCSGPTSGCKPSATVVRP
jgi:hypothetical protein